MSNECYRFFGLFILLSACLCLGGCAVTLAVFGEDVELGELDMEFEAGPKDTAKEIKRKRLGGRLGFGGDKIKAYIQGYTEEFAEDYDAYGGGLGIVGDPTLVPLGETIDLVLPFKAGINATVGDTRFEILTQEVKSEIAYVEFEGDIAVGVRLFGFVPSVGFYVSSIHGRGEGFPDFAADDFDFDGYNTAGFFDLYYKHDAIPLFGRGRLLAGDVEGFTLAVGLRF